MIEFPVDGLLSEEECYQYLKRSLLPKGFSCPNGHDLPDDQVPHAHRREPTVDYRCRECGAVFNISTNTVWSKTHYDCSKIVMLLRGFAKGVPTKWLTDKMDLAYSLVLERRHRIQEAARQGGRRGLPGEAPEDELLDPEVEADEMYQNAVEKAICTKIWMIRPARGFTKGRGRGTYENDRPPIVGMVGRQTGWVSFQVCPDMRTETLQAVVTVGTAKVATIFTDENRSYLWLESEEES